jgi:uncharacterized protein YodC (DUF2158 family)
MEHAFKVGDVVQLKSGGPKMTVEYVGNYAFAGEPEYKAKCVWFEGPKRQEGVFALAALDKA